MKAPPIQPLIGKTVLVTRPRGTGHRLPRELRRQGARVVWQPTIQIDERVLTPDLDRALDVLDDFDWIVLTSPRGVAALWRRLTASGLDPLRLRSKAIAVVGPGTARALSERGIEARVIGDPYSAAGLLNRLRPLLEGRSAKVLYPRAASVSPTLITGLRELGADVVDVVAYRTSPLRSRGPLTKSLNGRVDCVVFCSPSAITAAESLRTHIDGVAVACIGPVTAEAAKAAGFPVSIVPAETSIPALAQAIAEHFVRAAR
jgi:uroporphyrinogen III methyltransferase/synthase